MSEYDLYLDGETDLSGVPSDEGQDAESIEDITSKDIVGNISFQGVEIALEYYKGDTKYSDDGGDSYGWDLYADYGYIKGTVSPEAETPGTTPTAGEAERETRHQHGR
jgi:hypothetical protein